MDAGGAGGGLRWVDDELTTVSVAPASDLAFLAPDILSLTILSRSCGTQSRGPLELRNDCNVEGFVVPFAGQSPDV